MRLLSSHLVLSLLIATLPSGAYAQSGQSFSDVPPGHWAYEAAEYLKSNGVLQGYADGTFKPDAAVKRAEAVKILAAALIPAEKLATYTSTVYGDAPAGVWYIPYIEGAREVLGIIDGPPKTSTFNGGNNVKKVEFLKMMLLANKIDPGASYGEINLPLATDVTNPSEWYYPYMRYAISSSVTMVDANGDLTPAKELTRGEVALLMYRLDMYKQGRRTQALLSETESEILNILNLLEIKELPQAHYSSARALLAARGALASKPDEAIVKGAVKTAEGFRLLLLAYESGISGQLDAVITQAGEAWQLAQKAREFSPALDALATQMQTLAKNMADEARALKGQ